MRCLVFVRFRTSYELVWRNPFQTMVYCKSLKTFSPRQKNSIHSVVYCPDIRIVDADIISRIPFSTDLRSALHWSTSHCIISIKLIRLCPQAFAVGKRYWIWNWLRPWTRYTWWQKEWASSHSGPASCSEPCPHNMKHGKIVLGPGCNHSTRCRLASAADCT